MIIREAMAGDVANVIEDQSGLLARRWAEYAPDLLKVEAEGLGGAQEDGNAGSGHIEAFGDHIDGHQNLHQTGAKVCNDLIAVDGSTKE